MQIALLGGTGDIGEGLTVRLAHDTDHDLVVGSRKAEKAAAATQDYEETLADHGVEISIESATNADAAAGSDVVFLAVPAYHIVDTIEAVESELDNSILVSPAVGMKRDEAGMHYNPPSAGSVTEFVASNAPEETPIVGACHNLAAGKLAALDADLDWDVPVVASDETAKTTVCELVEEIDGLRALDAGSLANAAEVESLTPLLINLAANNDGLHDLGTKYQ